MSGAGVLRGAVVLMALGARAAVAQLTITEIMYDPLSANDDAWEWLEVHNSGASPVDLNGYYAARFGDTTPIAAVNNAVAANTIIPAGGTAVLYRGNVAGTAADYNDQLFRNAWGLSGSVPLVAVENWPALTNGGGTAVGFWPTSDLSAAMEDDGTGTLRVANFNGVAFGLDYRTTSGFTASGNGNSLAWNGVGSNADPANWAVSVSPPATTSVQVTLPGAAINNTADVASPGLVPSGPALSGLLITEIMYNPASAEPGWEWVEVYNNTGSTITFNDNYVLSDLNSTALSAANIGAGSIPNGKAAVLYDASNITQQNMIDAWDPGGTLGVNFIGVTNFPQLSNSPNNTATTPTEWVAIWPTFADYQADYAASPRTTSAAVSTVLYDDDGTNWPTDNGSASIQLKDLSTDQHVGTNWALSSVGDPYGSKNAQPALGSVPVHPGGDVGTPGVFTSVGGGPDADFNDDGFVNGTDLATWKSGYGSPGSPTSGDANGDGNVDGRDFLIWQRTHTGAVAAAAAVPEPGTAGLLLAGFSLAALAAQCRRWS